MIRIKCDKCKEELKEQGALLFSPPEQENKVKKIHICKECYNKLKEDLETL